MADKARDSDAATTAGSPRSSRRVQTAIDSGAALLLTILVWPFPLARAMLPVVVNVVSILVLWQLIQIAYFTVTMMVWGATAGTHLTGLRVVAVDGSAPSPRQRALWGALSGLVAVGRVIVPVRLGERGLPEKAAGVDVVAAIADA
jgi:uncharacterized RDD family membrane protein YckC